MKLCKEINNSIRETFNTDKNQDLCDESMTSRGKPGEPSFFTNSEIEGWLLPKIPVFKILYWYGGSKLNIEEYLKHRKEFETNEETAAIGGQNKEEDSDDIEFHNRQVDKILEVLGRRLKRGKKAKKKLARAQSFQVT